MAVGKVNVGGGGSLIGARSISVTASSTSPVASKYGDVWIQTTNVLGAVLFQEGEPSVKSSGDIWINIGDVKSKFNVRNAMMFIARSETELNVLINSAAVLAGTPNAPEVEFWKSQAMSLYSRLGSVRQWNGSKWVFLVAYYWDGSAWTNFSQADWYTYVATNSGFYKILPNGDVTTLLSGTGYSCEVDAQGNAYLFGLTKTLYKFRPDGTQAWTFTYPESTNTNPQSIAIDKDGIIYLKVTGYLYKISPEGVQLAKLTVPGVRVAVDKDGYIYTNASTGQVGKYNPDGTQIWVKTMFSTSTSYSGNSAYGICVDPQGYVYVYNGYKNAVYKIPPDGSTATIFYQPTTVTEINDADMESDQYGNLYLAVHQFGSGYPSKVILKVNSSGVKVWECDIYVTAGTDGYAKAVSVDKDSYVYAGTGNNKVLKLNASGVLVFSRDMTSDTTKDVVSIATTPGRYTSNPLMW